VTGFVIARLAGSLGTSALAVTTGGRGACESVTVVGNLGFAATGRGWAVSQPENKMAPTKQVPARRLTMSIFMSGSPRDE
jgi:L-aminopeptidase/D-esterase-like protein